MDVLGATVLTVLVLFALVRGIRMLVYQDSLQQRLDEICN